MIEVGKTMSWTTHDWEWKKQSIYGDDWGKTFMALTIVGYTLCLSIFSYVYWTNPSVGQVRVESLVIWNHVERWMTDMFGW